MQGVRRALCDLEDEKDGCQWVCGFEVKYQIRVWRDGGGQALGGVSHQDPCARYSELLSIVIRAVVFSWVFP